MGKFSFFILSFLTFVGTTQAQDVWNLEKCINYGLQNSIAVQQANNNVMLAEVNANQQKMSRLPNVNGQVNGGYQFGRTIDPTTNGFVNQATLFNSLSVNANAVLWSGNSINNTIKKGRLDLKAAELNGQEIKNITALNISNAYLNILLANERLKNAQNNLATSNNQLEQTQKLIDAGVLPEANKWDLIARVSLDEQALINAQNQVDLALLGLKQLLRLPAGQTLNIETPTIAAPSQSTRIPTVDEVYNKALQVQPQIQAADVSVQSSAMDKRIASASRLPSVNVFGSLSSNYSDLALDFMNPDLSNAEIVLNPAIPVVIDGTPASIANYSQQGVEYPKQNYGTQINNNFGQSVGVSLQIPIYNQNRNSANIQRSEIQIKQATLNSEQKRQTLRSDIETAVANAKAGKIAYEAAQKSLEATDIALKNAERKFELGTINALELTTSRNNYDTAKNNEITAKYQYIFHLKIIDFYRGVNIKL